ncbi:MAG: hypothetical protein KDD13_07340, partial [Mangrovimonas sp.]|nr:hypothetical protein [Mangrovimonas sp.]
FFLFYSFLPVQKRNQKGRPVGRDFRFAIPCPKLRVTAFLSPKLSGPILTTGGLRPCRNVGRGSVLRNRFLPGYCACPHDGWVRVLSFSFILFCPSRKETKKDAL